MRHIRTTGPGVVLAAGLLAVLTACSPAPEEDRAHVPEPRPGTTKPATPTAPVRVEDGFMPDFRGEGVAAVYGRISGSMRFEDVSGQGRTVPATGEDWKVCTQEPVPGARIEGLTIVFGAVKNDENC
ncbi:hypothetical protein [Streptomyces roseicoloratus]|uniref:hypothetical protein n=1 Tax=Streptomyces roseicoloratus TaxID=2508722 RepID=UPI0010098EEA|nr:hypothetical protein [Streptomyces roseicoloratus]